jgi:2-dehydropantoate 2-reductase
VRFVVVGAGAIGAYVGARLADAGADVTLVARGPHYQAMRDRGLRLTGPDGDREIRPDVTDDLDVVRTADVVILGVKAHGLTAIAPRLGALLRRDASVVTTQNGIPWWYFQGLGGPLDGQTLEHVDPGGVIARAIEPGQVVGSIVYFSTEVVAPGVVKLVEGNRLTLGEPDGTRSDRCRAIAQALIAAGFRCPVSGNLRQEIWVKLLGNASFNPISALTGGTLAELTQHPDVVALVRRVMVEVKTVAEHLGLELPVSIDQRIAGAAKVGAHKTSMLQDLEAGRPLELGAVVGAVVELGERLGVETPATTALYACATLRDEINRRTATSR